MKTLLRRDQDAAHFDIEINTAVSSSLAKKIRP
jgi:hypothetical protein